MQCLTPSFCGQKVQTIHVNPEKWSCYCSRVYFAFKQNLILESSYDSMSNALNSGFNVSNKVCFKKKNLRGKETYHGNDFNEEDREPHCASLPGYRDWIRKTHPQKHSELRFVACNPKIARPLRVCIYIDYIGFRWWFQFFSCSPRFVGMMIKFWLFVQMG